MLNEARYEQDWVAQRLTPERPHMETNRWLNAVQPTRSVRSPLAVWSQHVMVGFDDKDIGL